ncbi:uncharacterized protein LOC143025310 [Oratosquilla oratoria]|uniref:uncharacterized protein LOC143025310 n=1 Tax=Oratosquilla oratoria TaxID=337810 RepID=UPI003F778288
MRHEAEPGRSMEPGLLILDLGIWRRRCLGVAGTLAAEEEEYVKVFGINTDIFSPTTDDSYARFDFDRSSSVRNVRDLTLCYWFKQVFLAGDATHLSYAITDLFDNAILTGTNEREYYLIHHNEGILQMESDLPLDTWIHLCYALEDGNLRFYQNGVWVDRGQIRAASHAIPFNGTLIIGQDQDFIGGGFSKASALSGEIAQVNIWSRPLRKETVENIASCREFVKGDIFSTHTAEMEVFGKATVSSVHMKRFCQKTTRFVLFTGFYSLTDAKQVCSRIGLQMYVPENEEENRELYHAYKRSNNSVFAKGVVWIGATRKVDWINLGTGEPLTYIPFSLTGRPNIPEENCLAMGSLVGNWAAFLCEGYEMSFACATASHLTMKVRGMCESRDKKTHFQYRHHVTGKPLLMSYHQYVIYEKHPGSWVLYDRHNDVNLARYSPTRKGPLVGMTQWTVLNAFCSYSPESQISLSLSPCDASEYMCDNGDCIPKADRCNMRNECEDKTDEDDCQILEIPSTYRRHRPPPSPMGSDSDPLLLETKVEILNIGAIEDTEQLVSIELQIFVSWYDLRLNYRNLSPHQMENVLSTQDLENLWVPAFEYQKLHEGFHKVIRETMYVNRTGPMAQEEINLLAMDTRYSGISGRLMYTRQIVGRFSCAFRLFVYPFDMQHCLVRISLSTGRGGLVTFHPEVSVEYTGDRLLPAYEVDGVTIQAPPLPPEGGQPFLEIKLDLSRRFGILVLNTMMPSTMLLLIAYFTLFVKPALLQVRLVVTLTVQLVMYTLFSQVSSSLPTTASLKMIDLWFFFCIFVPFFIIVIHIFSEFGGQEEGPQGSSNSKGLHPRVGWVERTRKQEGKKWTQKAIMHFTRVIALPLGCIVFSLLFWITIVVHRSHA